MLVAVLCLGGVTHPGLLAVTVALAVLTPIVAISQTASLRWREARIAIAAMIGAAAWDAFQLIPLPPAMLRTLTPHAAAAWFGNDAILGKALGWHPISVDLAETAFMAVCATAVAAFFIVCLRHACGPKGARSLVIAVGVVVVCFDLVALGHSLIGATEVYGLYPVIDRGLVGQVPIVTPLMNANHAAALACVGPPLLVGFSIEARSPSTTVIALAGAAVSAAVAIMTFSRGGFAVLAMEMFAMTAYRFLRPGDLRSRAAGALIAAAAAALAIAAALYVALERILGEARDTNIDKVQLFARSAAMIPDFAMTGDGRGAFSSAFAAYQPPSIAIGGRFTHVESWPIQLVIDCGVPFTIAFVGAIAWVIVRCVRTVIVRPTTFGAFIALCGLGIHDLADFSMEFVGVGLVAAALAAIVVSTRNQRMGAARHREARWPVIAACVVPLVAFLVLLRPHWRHGVDDDCRRVASEWTAGRLEGAGPALGEAMARHPAEPYLPMVAGVRLLSTPDAAPLLARAIKLGPGRPQGHFWLARWLLRAGRRAQAWAEYREALRLAPAFRDPVLNDLILVQAPLDELEATFTTQLDLESVSVRLVDKGRIEEAQRLDDDLLRMFPPAIQARLRIIARLVAAQDIVAARASATELTMLAPKDWRGYLALAGATNPGESREAIIERGLAACGEARALLEAMVRERGVRLGLAAVQDELERLRNLYAERGEPDRYFALQADIELMCEHPAAAVRLWLEAASAAVTNGDVYIQTAASVAEKNGMPELATSLYRRLAQHDPNDLAVQAALARLRSTAASGMTTVP